MAALQPPFLVVGDILGSMKRERFPEAWVKVKCERREAYGCGENGKRMVDGLHLYTRPGPEDHPDFNPAIRVVPSRDVLNLIGCELDEVFAQIYGRGIRDCAKVHSVGGGVMVLNISFVAGHKSTAFRSYCLVYDSKAPGALFLLPQRPHGSLPLCAASPLMLGQDKFTVALMVERLAPDSSTYPVLCLWSPPALLPATCIKGKHRLNNESEECAWIEKGELSGAYPMIRQHARAARGFTPTLVFSYKGSAVWGDLGQGILYCDCADLNVGRAPVNFKLKMLPLECREAFDMDAAPYPMYRNMGCVGDSIWFVHIKPAPDDHDAMVKVWTLDRLSEEEEWKPHREFSMQTIWDLQDGSKLPKTAPMFPFFRQKKDDAILYMLLTEPGTYSGREEFAHLLGIDLSSSCEELRLLPPRHLVLPYMRCPLILDPSFLGPRPRRMPV
ncbi:unnamed protein product [Alopecurus aequalis]